MYFLLTILVKFLPYYLVKGGFSVYFMNHVFMWQWNTKNLIDYVIILKRSGAARLLVLGWVEQFFPVSIVNSSAPKVAVLKKKRKNNAEISKDSHKVIHDWTNFTIKWTLACWTSLEFLKEFWRFLEQRDREVPLKSIL